MDVERTIQFLLQHAASTDERLDRLENVVARLGGTVDSLASSVQTLTGLVGKVAQGELRILERRRELQEQTDERLNALIRIADSMIRREPPPGGGAPN